MFISIFFKNDLLIIDHAGIFSFQAQVHCSLLSVAVSHPSRARQYNKQKMEAINVIFIFIYM